MIGLLWVLKCNTHNHTHTHIHTRTHAHTNTHTSTHTHTHTHTHAHLHTHRRPLQLDVLACNTSSRGASLAGRITVDGAPRSGRQFAGISCYVQQKDVLLSSATVCVGGGAGGGGCKYWYREV